MEPVSTSHAIEALRADDSGELTDYLSACAATLLHVRRISSALLLCLLLLGLMSTPAEAIPVVMGWGTSITSVGQLPPKYAEQVAQRTGEHLALGYKYSYFAVFGLDLWTWSGGFCLFEGTKYRPLSDAQAEDIMKGTGVALERPFLYRFPIGLLVFGWIVFAFVGFVLVQVSIEVLRRKLDARASRAS